VVSEVSRWDVMTAAGAVGREGIETDLECIELNYEIGEVYNDWENVEIIVGRDAG